MDIASLIGIILGIGAIIGGNFLEGGNVFSILQPTAALIVFGGTLGATLLSFPLSDVRRALGATRDIFVKEKTAPDAYIREIVDYAAIARRRGLLALEQQISTSAKGFLGKALSLAVDGMNPKLLKETLEQENIRYYDEKKRAAKVFDTAGGYSPTIGILGAVLGLIHVMENLSDPSKLGAGIAVAFVATIYGVGFANLILLPMSKKLINRLNYELSIREMIIEGAIGIQSGINPHYLEERLKAFIEIKK